jgi:methyl-accepting chemotaxis protein
MAWLKNLKISTKLVALVLGLMIALVGVNYWFIMREFKGVAHLDLQEQAAAFTAVADEAKNHTSKLHADGDFNTAQMVEELKAHVAKGGDYKETRMFKTIPVVAGWSAAGEAANRQNMNFKVYAFDARNKGNEPEKGSFEEQLLRDLEKQFESGGEGSLRRDNEATNELVYMRAIELDASCMSCHGDPAVYDEKDATGGYDGKDVLGFKMEGWKPGDMHGAYTVVLPLSVVDAQVAGFFQKGMMVTIPMLVVTGVVMMVLMRRMLTRPVNAMVKTMQEIITNNDLTRRINLKSNNEVGQIAHWFDEMVGSLQQIISSVTGSARQVAAAATQIAATSEEMASGLSAQEKQASQVSAAVEEMSASITEVAQRSQTASKSAGDSQGEATKGGEIVSGTVSEIHRIAEDVKASADKMSELGAKGEKIGSIIEVINDIADQTNLLALNAAIEAARAGEQGRGFAVVADEVRRLAERTSQATEEVARSIREIQNDTRSAIERIETGAKRVAQGVELANSAGSALSNIVSTSQTVASMVQSIAAAAEEQSAASSTIAKSVEEINAVTRESAAGAGQAAQASMELSKQAESLQQLVGRFKA